MANHLIEKYLGEASEVPFDSLDKDKQKSILNIVKKENIVGTWDGIHGNIVSLESTFGDKVRLTKKEIAKLARDKNIRWIDVDSIGF